LPVVLRRYNDRQAIMYRTHGVTGSGDEDTAGPDAPAMTGPAPS
jgi:hypothetical protein